jgi:2'-5' RNA ligase
MSARRASETPLPSPSMPAVLRLFVALDLPNELQATLAALEFDQAAWRPVQPQALHLTLAFLGRRPQADVELIRPLVEAETDPVPLAIADVLLLPPRRARVLTVALEDPTGALRRLQARVSSALEHAGVYTPERRPFRPHVTLARIRPRVNPPRDVALTVPRTSFQSGAVTLYASHLSPKGARYEPLATSGYIQP